MANYVWMTKRKGKRGVRYVVRWIEPETGRNPGKTFKRLEDAREFEVDLRRKIRDNEYQASVKITYDDWVVRHLRELEDAPDIDLSPKTIAWHRESLNALGEGCRPKSPHEVNPKMIRAFRKIQLATGLAARTINKRIRGIKSALSYAVRAEIIPSNKLFGPHRLLLREEEGVMRILEVGEVKVLMDMATDVKLKIAMSLAYYHGMRRGELCWLQWQDVDLEGEKINIMSRPGERTKSRRSRPVALRPETADLFSSLLKDRVNEYVFEKPKLFYWQCGKKFESLVESAGLDHCTLHDLRKTCNTIMKEKGVSSDVAMQILGHKPVTVNDRHYTGRLTEQVKIAINLIPTVG